MSPTIVDCYCEQGDLHLSIATFLIWSCIYTRCLRLRRVASSKQRCVSSSVSLGAFSNVVLSKHALPLSPHSGNPANPSSAEQRRVCDDCFKRYQGLQSGNTEYLTSHGGGEDPEPQKPVSPRDPERQLTPRTIYKQITTGIITMLGGV